MDIRKSFSEEEIKALLNKYRDEPQIFFDDDGGFICKYDRFKNVVTIIDTSSNNSVTIDNGVRFFTDIVYKNISREEKRMIITDKFFEKLRG